MKKKEKKQQGTKKQGEKQSHLLVWIAAAVILIPTLIVGIVVMTSTENSGEPVVGSRFSENDLDPAISEDAITQVQEAMQGLDYVESVEVNLKSATLRININLEDQVDEADQDLVENIAQDAYDAVNEILPVDTYFSQKEDGKMYDLSINVYNYSSFDEEHTEDHWIYVCLTKTSASQESVVDVPLVHQVGGMAVIRAHDKSGHVAGVYGRAVFGYIVDGRAVAELDIHAPVRLGGHLRGGVAFVVGGNSAAEVGVERIAEHAGGVAVDNFAGSVRRLQLFYDVRIRADDAGKIHKFAQPEDFVEAYIGLNILSREHGAARFEGRCGHARGELNADVERHGERGIIYIFQPGHAADVGDFVRIGDDGCGAAGHDEGGEFFGGEH